MGGRSKQRGSQPASATPPDRSAVAASDPTSAATSGEPSGGPGSSTWARPASAAGTGTLAIVATPIGNLGDISRRAVDCLAAADLVLCEDTRVSGRLLAHLGLQKPLRPYHDHNAAQVRPEILGRLAAGETVALISDAGTPLISDPGYRLVREAAAEGHAVTPVPGASAAMAALMVAGLPTDRFLFAGFLPNRQKARRDAIAALKSLRATLVFYETGPRLLATLDDLDAVLGGREAVVARELTKRFEELRRAPLEALAAHYRDAATRDGDPKGELVLLVGPPSEGADALDDAALDTMLRETLSRLPLKAAVDEVADESGRSRNEIYKRALALRQTDPH